MMNPLPAQNSHADIKYTHAHTHLATMLEHLQSKNKVCLKKRGEKRGVKAEISQEEGAFSSQISEVDTGPLLWHAASRLGQKHTLTHTSDQLITTFSFPLSTVFPN